MRKTVAGVLMTLDGVVESPRSGSLGTSTTRWVRSSPPRPQSDVMLLGRRTYEEFAAFWPTQGSDLRWPTT